MRCAHLGTGDPLAEHRSLLDSFPEVELTDHKCTCSGKDVCLRYHVTKHRKLSARSARALAPSAPQGCRSASRVRLLWVRLGFLSFIGVCSLTSHDVTAQKSTHLKVREGEGGRSSICWLTPQVPRTARAGPR